MSFTRSLVFASLSISLAFAQDSRLDKPLPPDRAKGASTISTEDLKSWLTTLTSEEYGGRQTGTEGFLRAATFVRDHFKGLGLLPYGDEKKGAERSYWQSLAWGTSTLKEEMCWFKIANGGKEVASLTSGKGLAGRAATNMDAKGKVVLVNATAGKEAELAKLQVKDCIALVHVKPGASSQPAGEGRRGQRGGRQGPFAAVRSELAKAGPAAVIFTDDDQYASSKELQGTSAPGGSVNPAARAMLREPTTLYTSKVSLAEVLSAAGKDQQAFAADAALVPLENLTGELKISVDRQDVPAYNVIGVLPGSDPKLKDEFVVIGSHLDHLGTRGGLHPGADDDGSGSVGVLAVSRALAKNNVKPRRSILFVAFCGEEMGLLGSDYFAKNPPIPLASIVSELQMDMIGRDEEESPEGNRGESAEDNRNSLHLIGTKKMSMDLHGICMAANEKFAGFDLEWDEEGMFGRSDHANFARFGVPVAFFFTGLHRDYHQVSDTVEKINFPKLARVATYVYDIAFTLAQQDSRPLIDPELWAKSRRPNSPEQPAAPVRTK